MESELQAELEELLHHEPLSPAVVAALNDSTPWAAAAHLGARDFTAFALTQEYDQVVACRQSGSCQPLLGDCSGRVRAVLIAEVDGAAQVLDVIVQDLDQQGRSQDMYFEDSPLVRRMTGPARQARLDYLKGPLVPVLTTLRFLNTPGVTTRQVIPSPSADGELHLRRPDLPDPLPYLTLDLSQVPYVAAPGRRRRRRS
jgi:hypothetical protein